MTITPEQLEQCRKEFEAFYNSADELKRRLGLIQDRHDDELASFQAAWRPVPSVEEIAEVINESWRKYHEFDDRQSIDADYLNHQSRAIRRAFGGQDE